VNALPEWEVTTVTTDSSLLAHDARRAMSVGFFDASVNKTFMCFTGSQMGLMITAFDHDLKRWGALINIPTPDSSSDFHDYSHLFQSADGHLHLTYSRHNESLWIASSENPNSIEGNWNVREIGSDLKATYPMPIKASDGTLYIHYRVTLSPDDYRPMKWVKSADNGQTWSAPTSCIDYGNSRADNMNEIYLGQMNYEPDHPFGEGYGTSWTLAGGGPTRNNHDDYHKDMYYAFFRVSDAHWLSAAGFDLGINITDSEAQEHCLVFNSGELGGNRELGEVQAIGYGSSAVSLPGSGYPVVVFTNGKTDSIDVGVWNGTNWDVSTAFADTRGYRDFNRINGKLWMLKNTDNGNEREVVEFDGSSWPPVWTPVATYTPPLPTEAIFIDDANPEVLIFVANDTQAIYSVGSVALDPVDIPIIDNPSASVSHSTRSADLNVALDVESQADLWFVWDGVDQGTDIASWTNSQSLSAQTRGTVTATASGLQEGVDYIFRVYASNSLGSMWTSAETFILLPFNYTPLENFESRILNAAISGQGDWGGDTTSANEFSVRIDPDDAGNQVLWFNQGVDKAVFLNSSELRIKQNETSTVFFRIRAVPAESGAAELWLRMTLSDMLNPSGFSDGETDFGISDNGTGNILLSGIADPLTQAQWYRIWIVVDNASDSFDTYIQMEGSDQVAGLTNQAFRNGAATNDLLSLMFKVNNNNENGSNGDVWIDDIYVAHGVDAHSFGPVGPDQDMDKLPDQWEQDYFGSIAVSAGGEEGDWDSDSFSDLGEWLAGTNPTDASSYFRPSINSSSGTPAQITITWPALAERTYTIEASSNLLDGTWTPFVSDLPGETPTSSHTFPIEETSMFFRFRINP
jgi:hypothetical protein